MNIYFAGIGGVGIGPLAEIALDMGHTVCGSDILPSLMTESLERRGVTVSYNQNENDIYQLHREQAIDWFVYTAALPENNPELVTARELGIRSGKRDDFLAYIIKENDLSLLAVAGTHGKTTTTAMLTWALRELDQTPSYAIGSTLSWGSSGHFNPKSPYFVYECDEFDRNFLQFTPKVSLITAVSYDHPETYASEAEYLDAFKQFGQQSGHVITWKDQHGELFSDRADVFAKPFPLKLAGEHNRRNATLVLQQLFRMGYSRERAVEAVESFPGTARRFERLAPNLFSDYAHHPDEIKATIQMARELSDKVAVVYQPHQNIRQHLVRDRYTTCFEGVDFAYWLPTYLTREDPDLELLSPEQLTAKLTNRSRFALADMNSELWDRIQILRNDGYLVVCMGAGTIDGWLREKLLA